MVDEFKFLVQPVIAGRGKRFFAESMKARMRLVETRAPNMGVVFSHYERA